MKKFHEIHAEVDETNFKDEENTSLETATTERTKKIAELTKTFTTPSNVILNNLIANKKLAELDNIAKHRATEVNRISNAFKGETVPV